MRLIYRQRRGGSRSSMSFGVSAGIHGSILAWLAFSPAPAPKPKLNLYDQEIKPNERKIVWYHLRDRLPEVTSAASHHDPRPPRALRPFNQEIVAGLKEKPGAHQMIYVPAP